MNITRTASLNYAEYGVAALLTLAAVALHLLLHANVGEPWRDEVSAIAVASMPTFGEVWAAIRFDSFPILYYALLHIWMGIFGDTTASLRALGLGLGLGALAASWWLARRLRIGAPLLLLAMVAVSAAVIRYGDSARAYGLGLITASLMLGSVWTLLSDCSKKSIAIALIACLAASHTTYQNSLLLLVVGSAAILASAINRRWQHAGAIAIVCAVTAASVMIYLPALSYTKSLAIMFKWSISARDVFAAFGQTVSTGYGDWQKWTWLALAAGGIAVALVSLRTASLRPLSTERGEAMTRALFVVLVIPLLALTYTVFLIWSDYAVRPWYLLALMLVLAAVIEAGLASWTDLPPAVRLLRLALALVIGTVAAVNAPAELTRRATNMPDLIAAIEREGGPNDLIVVTEWYAGLTFNHLYRGKKAWMTIPDMGAHSVHRWDTLKERLQDRNGIARELEQIQRTIHAGHRVFVIGGFPRANPQMVRGQLPPAPHPEAGWAYNYYTGYWAAQIGVLLLSNATQASVLQPQAGQESVMYWENLQLLAFSRTN